MRAVLKEITRLPNKEGNPNWRLVTDHGTFTSGPSTWGYDVDPWWKPGDVLIIDFGEADGERFSVKKEDRVMEEAVEQTVKTGRVDMVDSISVADAVIDPGVISDAVARTIAASWQSPGPWGQYLASLASGCEVEADVLMEAIDIEVDYYLDAHALKQWVEENRS